MHTPRGAPGPAGLLATRKYTADRKPQQDLNCNLQWAMVIVYWPTATRARGLQVGRQLLPGSCVPCASRCGHVEDNDCRSLYISEVCIQSKVSIERYLKNKGGGVSKSRSWPRGKHTNQGVSKEHPHVCCWRTVCRCKFGILA